MDEYVRRHKADGKNNNFVVWSTIIKNADETDNKVIFDQPLRIKRDLGSFYNLKNPALYSTWS
jgi:hypothetical protein